jgi:hypothetical protein
MKVAMRVWGPRRIGIYARCLATRVLVPADALGTSALLKPEFIAKLQPCRGLALSLWPGPVGNWYQLSLFASRFDGNVPSSLTTPTGVLIRELFYMVRPEAPLRVTGNKSLPAAHLTPAQLGHIYGLSLELVATKRIGAEAASKIGSKKPRSASKSKQWGGDAIISPGPKPSKISYLDKRAQLLVGKRVNEAIGMLVTNRHGGTSRYTAGDLNYDVNGKRLLVESKNGDGGGSDADSEERIISHLVHELREVGFAELSDESGVRIGRFARVAMLMAEAEVCRNKTHELKGVEDALYGGVHEHVSAIVLTFLWMKALHREEIFQV